MAPLPRLLIIAAAASAAAAAPARNPKRGFVADGCTGGACRDYDLLTSAGWYYDYNPNDPYSDASHPPRPQFTPMHWCISSTPIPQGVNATFLMGFNEPNNAHNCNKSPEEVAVAWADVMKTWGKSSILVSPATAGNGVSWYSQFFGNCSKLYGAAGCQIQHLATHDYSCDAASTMGYLQQLHALFKLPVWLTEMSCGDGAANKPMSQHLAYMREVFPLLDKADYVYRYAWMSAHSANRGLVESSGAALTPVGQLFASI